MSKPTAALTHFPYTHRTMAEVKREEFFSLLAIGWPVSTAAKRAHMTLEQAVDAQASQRERAA